MTDTGSSANADEESTPDEEAEDSAHAGGLSAPGGGPTRVVSSRSVDDILGSLDETPAANDPKPTSETTNEYRAETATDGRASAPDASEDEGDGPDRDSNGAADADGARANREESGDDESIALEYVEETEGLSERVDAGTVTGADVRAAEAGEGRERTPEIDEIDLSLDDLEAPVGSDGATASGDAGDAGPLAGAVSREETTPATADDDSLDGSESAGLLGRLKRLFSR